jgi:hypothetical protein
MFTEAEMLAYQTKEWSAIPRIARTVPFGYVIDAQDPDLLQPVVFELEALEKAKVHLQQFSYRDVARWLAKTTGRYISHMGLKKRVESERRNKRKARSLEQYAVEIEQARAKAEKVIKSRIGAGDTIGDSST